MVTKGTNGHEAGLLPPEPNSIVRTVSIWVESNECRTYLHRMDNFRDGTYEIIGCAMHVHRSIGSGLREKPYENAMMIALRKAGIPATQQRAYPITYEGSVVGDCIPDITAGDVLLELKSVESIGESERAQMLNYLRIAKKDVGLVINFRNAKIEFERLVR